MNQYKIIELTREDVRRKNYGNIFDKLKQVAESVKGDIVVDMGQLSSIDSTVITLLLHMHTKASDRKEELFLVNMNDDVYELLEIVGVSKIIAHYDTLDDYIKSRGKEETECYSLK
jgi:anti-anti-sigma factor